MKPNKTSVRVVQFFVHSGPDFSGGLVTQQLCKKSSEVHPRTGNEGPEGEQVYSSTLSLTSAIDGVDGQRHATPRHGRFTPGKEQIPIL